MTMSKVQRIGFGFFVVLSLAGCDQVAAMLEQGAEQAVSTAEAAHRSEDDMLGEKLNGYIPCINSASRSVMHAAKRYYEWVDKDAGPTGKERHVYGLFEIGQEKSCTDGVAASATLQPRDEALESAASEYVEAFEAARKIVNEAQRYYGESDYEDDDFAKGKELHPKLTSAFDAFTAADQKLRSLVVEKNDALQVRALEKVEKEEGRKLRFQDRNVMAQAKKLVAAGDVQDLEKLDPDALGKALEQYDAAVRECRKYVDAHPAEADSVTSFSSFVDQAEEVRKAAKELLRRKRDGTAFTKTEQMHLRNGNVGLVEGTPGKLIEEYNDLVGDSNRLNWHFYEPAG